MPSVEMFIRKGEFVKHFHDIINYNRSKRAWSIDEKILTCDFPGYHAKIIYEVKRAVHMAQDK